MTNAWTLTIDEQWIAWLTFNTPGEKVNTFNAASMTELESLLDELADNEAIKAIAIRSGKDGNFIAGADISELQMLDTIEEAREKALDGQRIFAKLAAMPVPTVAVIHGACMGGGLELALACDYRLVTDDPRTTLALPEVKLGILPAWNGTVRLPRLIGLANAMDMTLTGRSINTRKAKKLGLADSVVAHAFLEEQTTQFIDHVLRRSGRRAVLTKRRKRQSRLMRAMEATRPGRAFMYRRAAQSIRKKTHGHYPAPFTALNVLRRTYKRTNIAEGGQVEADALAELACGDVSRHLVWLFQSGQRAKKYSATSKPVARDLNNVAIVGAGIMGSGIAWAATNAGMNVRLKDMNWDAIASGTSSIASAFRARVKRRKMTEGRMNLAMHRVTGTTDYSGFGKADIVIEAIIENLDIKTRVLREIEQHVSNDAVICTNTSSLPLEDLAKSLKNPKRFVGLHFFNPVPKMPLVEIVPTAKTSPSAVDAAVQLVQRMGKTPVVVGGCAGFLVNRILVPYLVESAWMMEEGAAPKRIDDLLVDFGMPMGPLALVDEVGIDVGYTVAKTLERAYGERMKVPSALGAIAESGELLGRKNGKGIYLYKNGHSKPNPAVRTITEQARITEQIARHELPDDDIVDRAVLLMVNEAARCLDEHVVNDAEALDLAMVFGTGFAPFRGGLLRYADQRGLANVRDRLNELAAMYGERFAPAPLIERLAAGDGRFYDSYAASGSKRHVA